MLVELLESQIMGQSSIQGNEMGVDPLFKINLRWGFGSNDVIAMEFVNVKRHRGSAHLVHIGSIRLHDSI